MLPLAARQMFRKPFPPTSGPHWIEPLSQSLQACRPTVRQRRRVTEVSLLVLALIQDLQLHRGLSCALLGGQQGFRGQHAAVAEKLQRSLIAVAEPFGRTHPVFRGEPWQQLLLRWDSLRNGWVDLDYATNLSVHSGLVLGLVSTLKTLAEHNSDCLGPRRTRVLVEWPTMIEHLGMLRALGLHVIGNRAARADPNLCAVFKEHLHEARSTLASTADSLDGPRLLDDSELAIVQVIALRDDQAGSADPQAYSAAMTRLIDAWYRAIRERLHAGERRARPR